MEWIVHEGGGIAAIKQSSIRARPKGAYVRLPLLFSLYKKNSKQQLLFAIWS
jgi:hypothetical protein